MSTQIPHTYYANETTPEECLKNGTFVRRSQYGLGQFNLGDFMGFIEDVPEGMVQVDTNLARSLIPDCCR